MFKLEPIGSTLFSSDVVWDEKGHARISYIYVTFTDDGIKSIQFIYFHEGVHVESKKHGYSGGKHTTRVKLENDEYLTALSGVYGEKRITSLTFHTNKRSHGPFCKRDYDISFMRKIDVGICDRSEFCGLFGSFSEVKYGGYLTSIGMYVSHNTSIIDQDPRTRFGATYDDHHFVRSESLDHTSTSGHYQCPNIVDGFPVNPIRRRESKLKDKILSKFNKAIRFLLNL
ncbi:unnamed protein product [Eruca vesicaria subsp. sativa]|uniref:Jacalin-type lectin domain-containing protein n=1 Tax=Eruca vesicaria subsp. sativa TaxID=29727 RepID=A0ABC8LJW6_ERUVS|nr:unnamed protein product [Eruca vesicaria subsp. sativa]